MVCISRVFEIRNGESFFSINVWIDVFSLLSLFLKIVILLIWLINIFEKFVIVVINWLMLESLLVKSEIVCVLFLILFFKLLICELVSCMNDDKWLLCWIRSLVIWLVCFVNMLMWDVSIFILFIVVVLKRFLDNEFINGNNDFVCFFCWILRFIFGIRIWIDCIVLL